MELPLLGGIGFVLWTLTYFIFAGLALGCLAWLIYEIPRRRPFVPLLVGYQLIAVTAAAADPANMLHDTIQQVDCALARIAGRESAGFHSLCFIGYMTRQYYLSALPSLLFGRSILLLNTGGNLYFLIGLPIFAAALRARLGATLRSDLITALALTFPLHSYWTSRLLVNFEQAAYPFSLTMLLGGLLLRWQQTRRRSLLALIGLVLNYLIFGYTPAIAVYFGAIPLLLFSSRPGDERTLCCGIAGATLLSFVLTFRFRPSMQLFYRSDMISSQDAWSMLGGLARQALPWVSEPQIWSAWFQPLFVISLAAALLGALGRGSFALAMWIALTFVAAVLAKGYVIQSPAHQLVSLRGLMRTPLVLPVFCVLFATSLQRAVQGRERWTSWPIGLALALYFVTGVAYRESVLEGNTPRKSLELPAAIGEALSERKRHPEVAVYIESKLWKLLVTPGTWSYFIPGIASLRPIGSCRELPLGEQTAIYIFRKGERCREAAEESGALGRMSALVGSFELHAELAVEVLCDNCVGEDGR